jgi:hypothetical protein
MSVKKNAKTPQKKLGIGKDDTLTTIPANTPDLQNVEGWLVSCKSPDESENDSGLELVERIDFKNGKNVLSIRFSKRTNRLYRMQVFLNDETEIRPVTYTGSSQANGYWGLLKRAFIQ